MIKEEEQRESFYCRQVKYFCFLKTEARNKSVQKRSKERNDESDQLDDDEDGCKIAISHLDRLFFPLAFLLILHLFFCSSDLCLLRFPSTISFLSLSLPSLLWSHPCLPSRHPHPLRMYVLLFLSFRSILVYDPSFWSCLKERNRRQMQGLALLMSVDAGSSLVSFLRLIFSRLWFSREWFNSYPMIETPWKWKLFVLSRRILFFQKSTRYGKGKHTNVGWYNRSRERNQSRFHSLQFVIFSTVSFETSLEWHVIPLGHFEMSSIPLCNVSKGKHITITTNTSHFANLWPTLLKKWYYGKK